MELILELSARNGKWVLVTHCDPLDELVGNIVVYKLNKKFSKIVHSYVPECDMTGGTFDDGQWAC